MPDSLPHGSLKTWGKFVCFQPGKSYLIARVFVLLPSIFFLMRLHWKYDIVSLRMMTLTPQSTELIKRLRAVRVFACVSAMFAVCLCTITAHGQYRFDHWTADNGLPQNSVREILHTRDGYLWFTTFDGLVRFDGVRFTVFNKSNSPGIPSNRFVSLFEDRQGDLWAALENGEVVRRHEGRFTSYGKSRGLPEGTPQLVDDGQGNPTAYYLQYSFDEQRKGYAGIAVLAYRWSEGQFQPAEELSMHFSGRPMSAEEAADIAASKIIEEDCWMMESKQLIRFRRGGGIQVYDEHNGLPGTQPRLVWGEGQPLQVVTHDAVGRLWLTDLQSMRSQLMSLQAPEGFEVVTGYADKEGNYWFVSYNSGLFHARRQTATPFGKAQGLDVKEVYPMLESRDGALWIGTTQGVFRLKDAAFTKYNDAKIWLGRGITTLYEDRAGQLWLNGFWRLVEGSFVPAPWMNESLLRNPSVVWTVCEDRAGAYWYGMGTGVMRYQDGRLTQFTSKDGLAGDDTKVIIEDGAGGIWLGSYGGLTHYKDGTFSSWTDKDGLPSNSVRALKLDADGTLWIGTYDSGLGRFKDGKFTSYTSKDGLFDNGVFQILEDDFGWLWMSCNRGIYRVRKQELNDFADGKVKTLTCLSYNKNDGMPSSECNGGRWPAGVKTRDGKLWFPTMGGIAMIDPAAVKANTQPPPVVIEAMRVNNQAVTYDVWEAAKGSLQSAIEVKPGQDNFEIEYTALSFINSENLRFRYKLEGADEEWVEAGTRRTAYFSYLSPGDYTFKVIAANADGVWNLEGASVRIRIVPPFWRTWWFIALATLSIAAAIVGIWKYREAQLKRVQMAQEAFARQLIASQEAERKRIAGELHDSIGQSLVIIRNWALLGASQLEDNSPAREELDEINTIASRSINEVREIAYNLGPYHLERLGFENSIRDMVKRLSQVSGITITTELDALDGALSRETEMSLYRITQEALNNVVKHSQATEVRVLLKREVTGVRLSVADNGKGFKQQATALPDSTDSGKSGFGLNGMAERVRLFGGTLTIQSVPGQGTNVETWLPDSPAISKGMGK